MRKVRDAGTIDIDHTVDCHHSGSSDDDIRRRRY